MFSSYFKPEVNRYIIYCRALCWQIPFFLPVFKCDYRNCTLSECLAVIFAEIYIIHIVIIDYKTCWMLVYLRHKFHLCCNSGIHTCQVFLQVCLLYLKMLSIPVHAAGHNLFLAVTSAKLCGMFSVHNRNCQVCHHQNHQNPAPVLQDIQAACSHRNTLLQYCFRLPCEAIRPLSISFSVLPFHAECAAKFRSERSWTKVHKIYLSKLCLNITSMSGFLPIPHRIEIFWF